MRTAYHTIPNSFPVATLKAALDILDQDDPDEVAVYLMMAESLEKLGKTNEAAYFRSRLTKR